MKRIILSAAFAMGVLVASAQTGAGTASASSNTNYTGRVSTDNEIRQMANQLQLNEGQYIRFRDLSRTRNEQLREANNMYANDASALKNRQQAINKEFESQLAQTVSEKQFTAYMQSQGRATGGSEYQAAGYGGASLEGGAATGTSTNGGAVNTNENDANKSMVMETDRNKESNNKQNRKNKKNKKSKLKE